MKSFRNILGLAIAILAADAQAIVYEWRVMFGVTIFVDEGDRARAVRYTQRTMVNSLVRINERPEFRGAYLIKRYDDDTDEFSFFLENRDGQRLDISDRLKFEPIHWVGGSQGGAGLSEFSLDLPEGNASFSLQVMNQYSARKNTDAPVFSRESIAGLFQNHIRNTFHPARAYIHYMKGEVVSTGSQSQTDQGSSSSAGSVVGRSFGSSASGIEPTFSIGVSRWYSLPSYQEVYGRFDNLTDEERRMFIEDLLGRSEQP
ncbi:MAG: hypothetical protein AAFX93_00995 [Verrucomicrobiota bacterium]